MLLGMISYPRLVPWSHDHNWREAIAPVASATDHAESHLFGDTSTTFFWAASPGEAYRKTALSPAAVAALLSTDAQTHVRRVFLRIDTHDRVAARDTHENKEAQKSRSDSVPVRATLHSINRENPSQRGSSRPVRLVDFFQDCSPIPPMNPLSSLSVWWFFFFTPSTRVSSSLSSSPPTTYSRPPLLVRWSVNLTHTTHLCLPGGEVLRFFGPVERVPPPTSSRARAQRQDEEAQSKHQDQPEWRYEFRALCLDSARQKKTLIAVTFYWDPTAQPQPGFVMHRIRGRPATEDWIPTRSFLQHEVSTTEKDYNEQPSKYDNDEYDNHPKKGDELVIQEGSAPHPEQEDNEENEPLALVPSSPEIASATASWPSTLYNPTESGVLLLVHASQQVLLSSRVPDPVSPTSISAALTKSISPFLMAVWPSHPTQTCRHQPMEEIRNRRRRSTRHATPASFSLLLFSTDTHPPGAHETVVDTNRTLLSSRFIRRPPYVVVDMPWLPQAGHQDQTCGEHDWRPTYLCYHPQHHVAGMLLEREAQGNAVFSLFHIHPLTGLTTLLYQATLNASDPQEGIGATGLRKNSPFSSLDRCEIRERAHSTGKVRPRDLPHAYRDQLEVRVFRERRPKVDGAAAVHLGRKRDSGQERGGAHAPSAKRCGTTPLERGVSARDCRKRPRTASVCAFPVPLRGPCKSSDGLSREMGDDCCGDGEDATAVGVALTLLVFLPCSPGDSLCRDNASPMLMRVTRLSSSNFEPSEIRGGDGEREPVRRQMRHDHEEEHAWLSPSQWLCVNVNLAEGEGSDVGWKRGRGRIHTASDGAHPLYFPVTALDSETRPEDLLRWWEGAKTMLTVTGERLRSVSYRCAQRLQQDQWWWLGDHHRGTLTLSWLPFPLWIRNPSSWTCTHLGYTMEEALVSLFVLLSASFTTFYVHARCVARVYK